MPGEINHEVERLRRDLAATSDPKTRVRLLTDLSGKLYFPAPQEAEDYLRQAVDEARAAGLDDQLGWALCDLAFRRYEAGDLECALRLCGEGLATARQTGSKKGEASANNVLGVIHYQHGDYPKAIACYQECLRISREIDYEGGISTALSNLAAVHLPLGEVETAMSYFGQAMELEQKRQDWGAIALSLGSMGECYEELGDWEKALECYYRSLATAEQHEIQNAVASSLMKLGALFQKRGKNDRALELLGRAAAIAEGIGLADQQAEVFGLKADAFLAKGDILAARGALERCRAIAEGLGDREESARAHRRMADALLASGEPDNAEAEIEQALKLAAVIGHRIELGMIHRVHGEVRGARKDPGAARDAFEQAIAVLAGSVKPGAAGAPSAAVAAALDSEPARRGMGFSYQLARAHHAFARFLIRERAEPEAAEHLRAAVFLFRRLGIVQSAEEANRALLSLASASARIEDSWLPILHSLSNLATLSAPLSELASACLSLLTDSLHYRGGAFFFYARPPYTIGRIPMTTLLALPSGKGIEVRPDSVQIPIQLGQRNVGMLYLCDPSPDVILPDRSFWETIGHMLALVVERVRSLVQAGRVDRPESAEAGLTVQEPDADAPVLRFGRIVCASPAMAAVLDVIERVAPTRANVLVLGESGTGKELVAHAIHDLSPRRTAPLVVINAAALPETLLEAELFGVEKGAATGVTARIGKLEQADGGTVFLDEIGDMPLPVQAKLLRAIQERKFERVGGSKTLTVDVRFIAATNRDLESAIKEGKFREDLFHRLNVISIDLPPLRSRREEMPMLIEHFMRKYSEEFMRPVQAMTGAALDALLAHSWPGNVRELENVIERAVVVAREGIITDADLPAALRPKSAARQAPGSGQPPVEDSGGLKAMKRAARAEVSAALEKDYLRRVLEKHDWRIVDVLREIGISRGYLYRLLDRYDLHRPGASGKRHDDAADK